MRLSGGFPIEGRFFVVIGANHKDRYAIFDTESSELVPFNEKPIHASNLPLSSRGPG